MQNDSSILITHFLAVLEFLGTFAFAISGIRHAAEKNFDWFGGFICGVAVAIGGGTIRDLLLGVRPFWMLDIYDLYVYGAVVPRDIRALRGPSRQYMVCLRHHRPCPLHHSRNAEDARHGLSFLDCGDNGHYDRKCRRRNP